jgi:hypothetical protein
MERKTITISNQGIKPKEKTKITIRGADRPGFPQGSITISINKAPVTQ